jgi:hypothetical protein
VLGDELLEGDEEARLDGNAAGDGGVTVLVSADLSLGKERLTWQRPSR